MELDAAGRRLRAALGFLQLVPAPATIDLPAHPPHHPGMDRRRFLLTSLAGALAVPLAAEGQQTGNVYTIGLLSSGAGPDPRYTPIFANALRDRGYELGGNLAVEPRVAAGKLEQLPELAADLVRRKVDIIVTSGSSETLVALKATATIPIVFISASPVELGLVRSLARPGANVTGVSVDLAPEVSGKVLELLKIIVPHLSRIAVLLNPDRSDMRVYERAGREAGQTLRIERRFVSVRTEGDLEAAFAIIAGERPDAVWVGTDSLTMFHRKRITDFAATRGLPTVSFVRAVAEDGGLMSYGPDFSEMFRSMATYIDKILKGAKPGDLPVEQPTKFELVINLKTAKALGLTIPPSLLLRADQVIDP